MAKCHICSGNHEMAATPWPWDRIHCPYDSSGKSKLSLGKQLLPRELLDRPWKITHGPFDYDKIIGDDDGC